MGTVSKNTRIDFRIGSDQKELIARAAALLGLTMSDFISSCAFQSALDIVRKHDDAIRVPLQDFERFAAALETDKEPSPIAVEEAKEYAAGRVEGDKYKW